MSAETPVSEVPEKTPAEVVKEAREALKAENDALEAEIVRKEKLRAQAMIGGRGEIAAPIKTETFDEKWRREAKVRYAGTGMDPT